MVIIYPPGVPETDRRMTVKQEKGCSKNAEIIKLPDLLLYMNFSLEELNNMLTSIVHKVNMSMGRPEPEVIDSLNMISLEKARRSIYGNKN
jgi:hypothetical protein